MPEDGIKHRLPGKGCPDALGPAVCLMSFDGGCFALDGLSIRVGNVRDHVKYRRDGFPFEGPVSYRLGFSDRNRSV